MSMQRASAGIRRWCPVCVQATATWIDWLQDERCSVHDPQNPANPRTGVHDDDDTEDLNWWPDDDDEQDDE